jgi:hypothetical protein
MGKTRHPTPHTLTPRKTFSANPNYLLAKKIRSRISTPDNLLTLDLPIYLKCRVKTLSLTDGMKPDQYRTALRQAQ